MEALIWLIPVILLIVLAVSVFGWYFAVKNEFNRYQVKIDEAKSGIDVALTKRFDLLTKSVAVAKGYAKHESETLEKVIAMRRPSEGGTIEDDEESSREMSKAFAGINAVAEQYPQLKADGVFIELQKQISDVEEQLQASRRVYNSNVSIYEQKRVSFPSSIIGKNFEKRGFFEAEADKREDVGMDF
jgi:LemA protein